MNRKALFRKNSRRRVLAAGQGAMKKKRGHTCTSGRHKRAFRGMRGRVKA